MYIEDNFLSDEDFAIIQDTMLGDNLPWFLNDFITEPLEDGNPDLNDYQLTHVFYRDCEPKSASYTLMHPILEKLQPNAILRIKANLSPRNEEIIESGKHIDFDVPGAMTAVFYVNDCNGYTKFETGETIGSVANRLVLFDAQTLHWGSTCTDAKVRCVINFNIYPSSFTKTG